MSLEWITATSSRQVRMFSAQGSPVTLSKPLQPFTSTFPAESTNFKQSKPVPPFHSCLLHSRLHNFGESSGHLLSPLHPGTQTQTCTRIQHKQRFTLIHPYLKISAVFDTLPLEMQNAKILKHFNEAASKFTYFQQTAATHHVLIFIETISVFFF